MAVIHGYSFMKYILVFLLIFPLTRVNAQSSEYHKKILDRHNEWRARVGVSPLSWSDEVAESAKRWAESLARKCDFKHSDSEYGENLWMGTADSFSPEEVVDSWGSEIEDYNYKTNKCKPGKVCGHYTQMVWKNTTEVGCAKVKCDGYELVVCQYNPPGNWVGQKPY